MVKPSQVHTNERKVVRRTVLVESDQGVSGRAGASWVYRMLKDGDLTSGDFEVRLRRSTSASAGVDTLAPTSRRHAFASMTDLVMVSVTAHRPLLPLCSSLL